MSDEVGGSGVQSLEIGMGILRAMADGQQPMMLKDVSPRQRTCQPPRRTVIWSA